MVPVPKGLLSTTKMALNCVPPAPTIATPAQNTDAVSLATLQPTSEF